MDFQHSDDRRLLMDSLSRYLRESYALKDRLDAGLSPLGFSAERWRELCELGALTALFGEAVGGIGGAGFDIMAIFEPVGVALVVEPLLSVAMIAPLFAKNADVCGSVMAGAQFIAPAFDEQDNRDDPVQITTRAVKYGNGWLLNGQKTVVSFVGSATQAVVSARTAGAPGDRDGLSLFCLPLRGGGCNIESVNLLDGGAGGTLSLKDVHVPSTCLLGEEGQAIDLIERSRAVGIVALSAEALGIMEFLKSATAEHLRTRQQFGRPLGKFQALQHRLTTCFLEVEQARSAVINAAAWLDAASPVRERAVSAAKYTIGRVGTLIAEEAIQLHGGMGMTWESPVVHYAKRLIMIGHQLGDEDYHLARYLALDAQGPSQHTDWL
jgi:alkylation response protein AidB-like acyl-CoA dehydrogenase